MIQSQKENDWQGRNGMKKLWIATIAIIGSIFSEAPILLAQSDLTPKDEAYFEEHIRPAFVQYCYDCHSEETGKTRGGLLLDTREGMLRGGDNGNILAGTSYQESMFWEAINWLDLEMPPKQKMPAKVIQKFKAWLEMGAPDPREREKVIVESTIDLEEGRKHWAFQKPTATPGASIDSFVAAKLSEASLKPVAAAGANLLLRRLTYDIVGLLPSPKEIAAFSRDWQRDAQAAVAKKVDELLKRPQYGERWGRHWLDVARYAESTGKDVNLTYPHIWRYRDYVFDSFNEDKPYDEFITEQIAGDLLKVKSDTEWQENLIATGFLAMGTKSLNEANPRQHRMDVADEQIDTVSQAILGLTVSCARCHDHKNDAISTVDYYALAGIFLSTDTLFGTVRSAQNKRASQLLELPIIDPRVAANKYSPEDMEQMRQQRLQLLQSRRNARGNENASQQQLAALRRRIAEIESKLDLIETDGTPITMAMAVQDSRQPEDANVLLRGDVEKPAQSIPRGFLQVLPGGGPVKIKQGQSGRRELATWLTSKESPLTARVMVNRIWLKLFGEGLVSSPNNWGTTGTVPTHPKLLDHLALEFMNNGWSIKKIIKEIALSKIYQRGSHMNTINYEQDPDNKLLWRMNPRPMDAETLRDSILTLGGGLDLDRPYGSQVAETGDARVGRGFNQSSLSTDVRYRSVYLPILRDDLPEALGFFDFADPNISKPKREATNVPAQALYLMNNPFVLSEAAAMAKNLIEKFPNRESQIHNAFLLTYSREPDEADLKAARQFFNLYEPVPQQQSYSQQQSPRSPRQGRRPGVQSQGQSQARRRGQFRGPMNGQQQNGGEMRGMRGGFPGMAAGRRRGAPLGRTPSIPQMTPNEQTLAVFCQSLMASAEFRQVN